MALSLAKPQCYFGSLNQIMLLYAIYLQLGSVHNEGRLSNILNE
ncbi:hypothetical protein ERYG_05807 [Escherichia coli M114]|nr:hypothetical protein ERYG_05807 [Escherichia coli M114]